jgi:phage tail-like protein
MTAFAFVGTATPAEWHEWEPTSVNVALHDDGVRIATEPTPTYVDPRLVVDETDVAGGIVDVAQDDCGDLYLLGGTGDLYVVEPGSGSTGVRRLRCHGDRDWGEPRALCVSNDGIYVAYLDDSGGLVRVVTKELHQTRRVVDAVTASDGTRVAVVDPVRLVTADHRVLLVDRGDDRSSNGRVVELRGDGTSETVLSELEAPSDLAVDTEGGLYVLLGSGPEGVVRAYDADGTDRDHEDGVPDVLVAGREGFATACVAVAARDQLVGGIAADAAGDRSLYRYRPETGTFERLPAFGRGCRRLVRGRDVAGDRPRGLYVLSSDTSDTSDGVVAGVTFIREAFRTRRNPLTGRYDAQLSARLDSGVPGVEWHRTRLRRTIEGRTTQVRVAYHATDDADPTLDVRSARWREIDVPGAADALLDDAVGRYLFVRLTLLGDEFASPLVESFRAYFPRQSYLRYLPGIYREDEASRAFVERYLSLFESAFVDLEEEIEHLTRYLDAAGVPTSHLSWLEGWLALETDETWPEPARRALVARAAELYRKRGTREGLLELLGLYLGHLTVQAQLDHDGDDGSGLYDPTEAAETSARLDQLIVDAGLSDEAAARVRDLVAEGLLTVDEAVAVESRIEAEELTGAAAAELRDLLLRRAYVVEYDDLDCIETSGARAAWDRLLDCPQCFLVLVRSRLDEEERRAVTRLVESTRPAHAVGRVVPLEEGILLGGHAYLGINSVLPDEELVLSRSGLGRDSVLGDRVPHGQLEVNSRLGDDSHLA